VTTPEDAASPTLLPRLLHVSTRFPRMARVSKFFHVRIYRLSGGRLMGRWFGMPVLVLETPGRHSAKRRTTTMTYLREGEGFVVLPINAGAAKVPAWWLNLEAAGAGVALVRGERIDVRPRVARGPERSQLWARYAAEAPSIEPFREYAEREIPVVVLERAEAPLSGVRFG
jgi:deazaflavin-dependent oxidoreductase (nitroreductase family)